jgi:hypothetical protein
LAWQQQRVSIVAGWVALSLFLFTTCVFCFVSVSSIMSRRERSATNQPRTFLNVEQYVDELGGNKKRPIKKVLIANNGIGAVKAIRSIRRVRTCWLGGRAYKYI